jgi:hypothetical protein
VPAITAAFSHERTTVAANSNHNNGGRVRFFGCEFIHRHSRGRKLRLRHQCGQPAVALPWLFPGNVRCTRQMIFID